MLVGVIGSLAWASVAGGTPSSEKYDALVARDEPVAWLRFGDTAGSSTIEDSVGAHTYTAANSGIVLGGAGPFSGSASGSLASGAFASLPADPLTGATVFTIEGWVYWAGGAYGQPVFELGSSSSDYMYLTPASSGTGNTLSFEIVSPSGSAVVNAAGALPAGAWSYVVVSEAAAGSAYTLSLSVNGAKPATTKKVKVTPSSLGQVSHVYLGRSISGESSLDGRLSNVAFYTKALTEAQVKEHYAALAPVGVEAPSVLGSPREGVASASKEGAWSGLEPFTFAFQWQDCRGGLCENIKKATAPIYTPSAAQVESTLQLIVTANDGAGERTATSPQSTPVEGKPANTALPAISGETADGQETKVGEQLKVSEGSWRAFPPASSVGYSWEACKLKSCSAAPGSGNSPSYRVAQAALGKTLRATVTKTNTLGTGSAATAATATVVAGPPVSVEAPAISGLAREAQELTAGKGVWAGTEPIIDTNYQWLRCTGKECHAIEGASGSNDTKYKLTASDIGHTIETQVTAKNSVGEATAASAPTAEVTAIPPENAAPPVISGQAKDEQPLTASTGGWTGSPTITYAYQWESCNTAGEACASIEGASGSTYVIAHVEVGDTIRVKVTATNEAGASSATSTQTATVVPSSPANTAPPTVSGEAKEGQTATANTGTWTGTPTIAYADQWQRCDPAGEACVNIASATGSGYTAGHEDVGSTLRVVVSATNAGGTASQPSQATAVVAAAAPINAAPPVLSGEASQGQQLTTTTGEWDGASPISYSYQWESCDSLGEGCLPITDATEPTYALRASEIDTRLRVVVTASNSFGSTSSTSTASRAVAGNGSGFSNVFAFGAAGTGDGQFNRPAGVALDGHGDLWVLDRKNNRVEEFSEAGEYVRQFGSEGGGEAQMERPNALAVNSEGDVWVLDTLNDRIEEFNEQGVFLRTTQNVLLESAVGMAIAPNGDVWVTLRFQGKLLVFNRYGTLLKVLGTEGSAPGQLDQPTGVAIDAHGHVWVAEWVNDRVQEFNEAGEYLGYLGSPGSALGQMNNPFSVATANGDVFVAEVGNARIQEFDEHGNYIEHLGSLGSQTGQFKLGSPDGIVVNAFGYLWVTDSGNDRLQEWVPTEGEPEAPSNTATPSISGAAGVAQTLLASPGVWNGAPRPTFTYRWERCESAGEQCQEIETATRSAYVPVGSDVGGTLRVTVTATNVAGSASRTSPATPVIGAPPESLSVPTVSGTAKDGDALSATPGIWEGAPPINYTYQWQRCLTGSFEGAEAPLGLFDPSCEDIEGATGSSYELQNADVETTVRVIVTAGDVNGTTSAASQPTAAIASPAPPENTGHPVISGTAEEGQTLAASTGTWQSVGHVSYAAQWQHCNAGGEECSDIEGATELTYIPDTGDLPSTLRVTITASNGAGSAGATSTQTEAIAQAPLPENSGAPAVEGVPRDGQTLHASAGTWGGAQPISYAYQWESCNPDGEACAPVEGATEPEYELSDGDIANTVRVTVTATDAGGSAQVTSAASPVVEPEAAGELQAPSISGTPDEHAVLHAVGGGWSGSEARTSYQWESCNPGGEECAPVQGATDPEYDLAEGDVGTTLRVRVGVTSRLASLTDVSPPTPAIGAPGALANTSPPSISGTPESGESLSVSAGSWSGEGLSYAYQWQACDAFGASCEPISGATEGSYTIPGADAGRTLRVLVTASAGGREAAELSAATQEVAAIGDPVVEQPPAIDGTALTGYTLSAGDGTWSGAGPLTYTYEWERCAADGGCTRIEAATESDYTPTEADRGAGVRVAVTATGPGGSTTAVSNPTGSIEPRPLTQFSTPSISGAVQPGSTLSAEPGIWSGSGPVSYAYQWESCNPHGVECTPIHGASEPSYTLASGDQGSTLRVTVTLTNPHGNASATSSATPVVPGGELSVEAAQEVAQQTDPAMLAPSTTTELEEQTIAPKLADGEQEITSQGTLTSSTVSKEIAGSFAVNTPVGELSLTPVEPLTTATTLPTLVNKASALFANTWPATDSLVRAEPRGATAMLDIRSAEAPQSFSWEVGIGPDQQLTQLSDGSVAVVTAPENGGLPGEDEQGSGTPPAEEGQPKTPEEEAEAEHEELESQEAEDKGEAETEVPPQAPPSAPVASTPAAESPPGQPQPQDTEAQYEGANSAVSSAEAQTDGHTLLVIPTPSVIDAAGNPVPSSLKVSGNAITLNVKPGASPSYPWIASFAVAAATDKASATKPPTPRYGLSDFNASTFGQEAPNKKEWVNALDPHLKATGTLKVTTARLVIPYDVLSRPNPARTRLDDWLKAVKAAGIPQPYIALGPDETCQKPEKAKTKAEKKADEVCWEPSASQYEHGIKALMSGNLGVKLWGAWNEPDLGKRPMAKRPHMAAQYWQEAQYEAEHTKGCGCTVIAGEFAFAGIYQGHYISEYKETIEGHKKHPPCLCSRNRPVIWGFHDYTDVVNRNKAFAEQFDGHFLGAKSKAKIWIGEAGVELQNGSSREPTDLATGTTPSEIRQKQREAATDFEDLHNASKSHRIDRLYYYSYGAPSQATEEQLHKEKEPPAFDSGLLSNVGEARPAYCVLLFSTHECPAPTPVAESGGYAANCAPYKFPLEREIPLLGNLNPNGSPVSYELQHGPTTAYGFHTPVKPGGSGSAPTPIVEKTEEYFTHDESHGIEHFRIVAHSGGAPYPSADATVNWSCAGG